jgi:hypothetical protein
MRLCPFLSSSSSAHADDPVITESRVWHRSASTRRTGLRDAPPEAGYDNRELGAMPCRLIGSWVSLPHDGGRGQLA